MNAIRLLKAVTCNLLLLSTVRLLGIEGLQISVQCSNVVLSWPSVDGEAFIVQHRTTLDGSSTWQTLTSSLPADLGTNLTFFVHTNVVQQPNCGDSDAVMAEEEDWLDPTAYALAQGVPMAIRADGSSSLVPLMLYPPGFDLSDFLIYDPIEDEWFQGSASLSELLHAESSDGSAGEGGQEDAGPPPETGFYRVVRNGLHLFGLTNGVALTGLVEFPIEVGADVSMQDIVLYADGDNPAQSGVITNESGKVVLAWNTAFIPNGTYSICIEGSEGFDQPAIRSRTNSVIVENGITFNEFTSTFGDQMWIYAVLLRLA